MWCHRATRVPLFHLDATLTSTPAAVATEVTVTPSLLNKNASCMGVSVPTGKLAVKAQLARWQTSDGPGVRRSPPMAKRKRVFLSRAKVFDRMKAVGLERPADLAAATEIGEDLISRYLTTKPDRKSPAPRNLQLICQRLGCVPADILEGVLTVPPSATGQMVAVVGHVLGGDAAEMMRALVALSVDARRRFYDKATAWVEGLRAAEEAAQPEAPQPVLFPADVEAQADELPMISEEAVPPAKRRRGGGKKPPAQGS